jgi:hypothetical protein
VVVDRVLEHLPGGLAGVRHLDRDVQRLEQRPCDPAARRARCVGDIRLSVFPTEQLSDKGKRGHDRGPVRDVFRRPTRFGITSASPTAHLCAAWAAAPDNALDEVGRFHGIVVLPNPDDLPPRGREHRIRREISLLIPLDLRAPPLRVRCRPGRVLRAAVPETTVYEDGDVRRTEDDVGRASESENHPTRHAIAKAASVKLTPNQQLGPRVAPALTRHLGAHAR